MVCAKIDIYRAIGVPEVWFWHRGRITIHVLRDDHYDEVAQSAFFPGIDLVRLAQCLDRPSASQAMREYRGALTAR